MKHVFYEPGQLWAIDFAVQIETGFVSEMTGETLEQLRQRYPNAVLASTEEWRVQAEASIITEPQITTRDRFIEMLEILPPDGWHRSEHEESFKMSERYSGRITHIFVRIGRTYYTFLDSCKLSHQEIVDKCKKFINGNLATIN